MEITTLPASHPHQKIRTAAVALEAQFLSEMLKGSGLNEAPGLFGGGAGEEQFASLLRQEQATNIAHAGGIGLAEAIFQSLARGGQ